MPICDGGTSGSLVPVNICIKVAVQIEVLIMAHGIFMSLLKRQEPVPAPRVGGVGGLQGLFSILKFETREEPGGWGRAGWARIAHFPSSSPQVEPTGEAPSASRTLFTLMDSGGLFFFPPHNNYMFVVERSN